MDSSNGVSKSGSSLSINLSITEQLFTDTNSTTSATQRGKSSKSDQVNVGMDQIYKSLTILGDKIIAKLNELLKNTVPDGIASLKPEEHTAEATAQRIADGSTGLFAVYAKQHPELQGEDLLNKFMATIRGGIKKGYEDAAGTLESLGAFQFDGVKSGIEQTMQLVEEKLKAFEDDWRKKNLPSTSAGDSSTAANTTTQTDASTASTAANVVA